VESCNIVTITLESCRLSIVCNSANVKQFLTFAMNLSSQTDWKAELKSIQKSDINRATVQNDPCLKCIVVLVAALKMDLFL
jgi:hypothetical protein